MSARPHVLVVGAGFVTGQTILVDGGFTKKPF